MNIFKRWFHSHKYLKVNDHWECEVCNKVPWCEKHQEFKYVHGWDNLTDCESCFKEWRKEKGL